MKTEVKIEERLTCWLLIEARSRLETARRALQEGSPPAAGAFTDRAAQFFDRAVELQELSGCPQTVGLMRAVSLEVELTRLVLHYGCAPEGNEQ